MGSEILAMTVNTSKKYIFFLVITACLFPLRVDAATTFHKDTILRQDTLWSGEILIEGVVVVGSGVTLTISPGTKVRFKKTDRNKDSIGDSEIRVLGSIKAQGTPENRIHFLSASPHPQPADWSYLLIFGSGAENIIQHCIFEHGFTGLQIHFSVARVYDCLFRNNREAIRFGRGDIVIEHNTITGNDTGIRFTRMEGPVVIRFNTITLNRMGVFLVPSGQNITDFFEPGRAGKPWNTGHLLIMANNIHDNSLYNLNLGDKQLWDLEITKNWWGTKEKNRIAESIFDKNREDSLGKALIEPFLNKPLAEAGVRW